MVASTNIKFYVHTNNNAPQLQNAYGSMINVLDACLVSGINIGTVSSLTASGTTVTASFSSTHNLMQYQVIKITGASQPEFNGEHRILTIPNSSSLTFELAATPSVTTATGAISASLPPLGWEKPFSSSNQNGGGRAAYRSLNLLLPSRPFLRVVDELDPAYTATYAKYAKVGIVEDMTDIDTMLGVQVPFDAASPDKNWVGTGSGTGAYNGWAKWYYAKNNSEASTSANNPDTLTPTDGVRTWILVGSGDYFYIIPSVIPSNNNGIVYGFGSFDSNLIVDNSNSFLSASLNYHAASAAALAKACRKTPLMSDTSITNGLLLLLGRPGAVAPYTAAKTYGFKTSDATSIHYSGVERVLSAGTDVVLSHVNLIEDGYVLRGSAPGFYWVYESRPYSELQIVEKDGVGYVAKHLHNFSLTDAGSTQYYGEVLLRVV